MSEVPTDLPIPVDDGLCDHLVDYPVPNITLQPTSDPSPPVNLSTLTGLTIVFCYPRTGKPTESIPDSWNAIPGARGCTPQACSFRDNFRLLKTFGVTNLFGLSTQSTQYQKEVKERLKLPYDLLSDKDLQFVDTLKLPTFEWSGERLVKRLILVIEDGKVVKCFYPIFPSDRVEDVIDWLKTRPGIMLCDFGGPTG